MIFFVFSLVQLDHDDGLEFWLICWCRNQAKLLSWDTKNQESEPNTCACCQLREYSTTKLGTGFGFCVGRRRFSNHSKNPIFYLYQIEQLECLTFKLESYMLKDGYQSPNGGEGANKLKETTCFSSEKHSVELRNLLVHFTQTTWVLYNISIFFSFSFSFFFF